MVDIREVIWSKGFKPARLKRRMFAQRRRQVAFAKRRDDDHDQLAGVFRAIGQFRAAQVAAPEEMPTSRSPSVAIRRGRAKASSF